MIDIEDVKSIIAKNITELRLLNNMTQLELGEKLNYSDKTVSKWERGESCPDVAVHVEIADIFGVSLDYLVRSENLDEKVNENKTEEIRYNRKVISYISESVVWCIAILAFIITSLITNEAEFQWLYFVYALPVVLIIKLIFNSIWFNPRNNYLIISAKLDKPVYAMTVTYRRARFFKRPVTEVYFDGPFYPEGRSISDKTEDLHQKVETAMMERSKNSNVSYIKYRKKTDSSPSF